MTGQIVIQSSPVVNNRRQPLLSRDNSLNVGEFAGSAAAECAAICCCCPCALMGCFVFGFYKVPSSIFRRIWKKRLMRKKNKKNKKELGLLSGVEGGRSSTVYCVDDSVPEFNEYVKQGFESVKVSIDGQGFESVKISIDGSAEVIKLDREMWEQFRDSGFWRSPSQRHL